MEVRDARKEDGTRMERVRQWARAAGWPGAAIWPLRLFLAVSFIWASVDKLRDPGFLDPTGSDFLGRQLALAAPGSPIGGFLTAVVVPAAVLFGALVMAGELVIGVATLLGWFTRAAALAGLLINLVFWLTITWDVQPFYFGADLPYMVGWLTLLLLGPGPLSVDALLRRRLAAPAPPPAPYPLPPGRGGERARAAYSRAVAEQQRLISRRRFNTLALSALAGAVVFALDAAAWPLLHPPGSRQASAAPGADTGAGATQTPAPPAAAPTTVAAAPADTLPTQASAAPPPANTPAAQAAPGDTPAAPPAGAPAPATATLPLAPATATPAPAPAAAVPSGVQIAPAGRLQVGDSIQFADPRTGGPAILVRLSSGFVAYSAVCTHEGCTVRYSPGQQELVCPCHGAVFDPKQNGAVVRRPARRPLAPIPIAVAPDGAIYVTG
jgi:thiosulfate dehydrogenase (quinone) large subunit